MKKIFTLIAVAVMALSANADNKIVKWAVSEAPTGGTISVTDESTEVAVVAFGTAKEGDAWTIADWAKKVTYNGVDYDFTNYVTTSSTNGTNSSELAADGSSVFNYFAIKTLFSGTLVIVGQNMGTNNEAKPTWLHEDGVVKGGTIIGQGDLDIAYDGQTDVRTLNDGSAVNGGIKIDAKAGSLYTISIQGSKGRWVGLIFDYDPTPTGIQTVKTAAENGAMFNAAGQQVGAGYKGLVIKNGRKYIVK